MQISILMLTMLLSQAEAGEKNAQAKANANAEALKRDYQLVEGRWKRQMRDGAGNVIHVVKEEKDKKSKVTYTDANGNVLREHVAEYRLERKGDLRLFVYFNLRVTKGPDQGLTQQQPDSYVYRVHGDYFFEVYGMRISEQRPPNFVVWTRDRAGGPKAAAPDSRTSHVASIGK